MKESTYKSYDELPLFLNAETVARVLGICAAQGYRSAGGIQRILV